MSKPDRVFRREMRRAILGTVLCACTLAAELWREFLHPDMTWARCWIEHPWHQAAPMVLVVTTLVVCWWPRGGAR